MDFKSLTMDVMKNALSVGVVQMVNVIDKVPIQSNNLVTKNLKIGAEYALARDMVNYMNTGQSDVLSMNYKSLLDNVVYNTATSLAYEKSGLTNFVIRGIDGTSPFDDMVNNAIIDGTLMTASLSLRDVLETSPSVMNSPLRYVLKPSELLN